MDEVTIIKGSILRELGWCDIHYYGRGVEGTLDKLPWRGEGGSSLEYTPSVPNYLSVLIGTLILRNL
jgi:hypothetical protein